MNLATALSSIEETTDAPLPAAPPEIAASRPAPGDEASAPVRRAWSVSDLVLLAVTVLLVLATGGALVLKVRHTRACHLTADRLLAAARTFQAFAAERGTLPEDADAGTLPKGMENSLAPLGWTAPTPIGGLFRWTNPAAEDPAAPGASPFIAITAFSRADPLRLSPADLLAMDRRIDDGKLESGNFRRGFNGWPIYVVRVQP